MAELDQIASELYDIGAIKFGNFTTKTGFQTPYYLDFRLIISYPQLVIKISNLLWNLLDNKEKVQVKHVCGVPYTALPLASTISTSAMVPMLIRRKEAKSYGTKKLIEGIFNEGDHTVIVEDVLLSGTSILETYRDLKKVGLHVCTIIVIVDRQQGGKNNVKNNGIDVRSIFTTSQLMDILLKANKLKEEEVKVVLNHTFNVEAPLKLEPCLEERLGLDFSTRAKLCKNLLASQLFSLMHEKQTTLCLAADFVKTEQILELASLAGPHIAVLKIHADIVEDFNKSFTQSLKNLSKKHNFFIMEDRKFADTENIVSLQYKNRNFSIAEWADFITVHAISGSDIIQGLEQGLNGLLCSKAIFIVAHIPTVGSLTSEEYIKGAVTLAKGTDIVAGFISQTDICLEPGLVQVTHEIKLSKSVDRLGSLCNTYKELVNKGADLIVVGKEIAVAKDPLKDILECKKSLWGAYTQRIGEKIL